MLLHVVAHNANFNKPANRVYPSKLTRDKRSAVTNV